VRELSLFSGGGGGLLATKHLLGWTTVAYVERDKYAQEILRARIRDGLLDDAPIFEDVRTFDGAQWAGEVDVVSGGYPCQPFSVAGKQRGEDDERHLWPEFARILGEVRPRLAFLENVPGHLRLGFERVLGDLAELGFDAEWTTLGADDVGAPHRRKRLWVLAHARHAERRPGDAAGDDANRAHAGWAQGDGGAGECCEVAHARRERDQRDGGSDELAGAASSHQGREEERERNGDAARCGGAAAEVAHADQRRRGLKRLGGLSRNGYAPQRHDADGCGGAGDLGDAVGTRLEKRQGERGHDGQELAPTLGAGRDWWRADPADMGDAAPVHAQGLDHGSRQVESWRTGRRLPEPRLGLLAHGMAPRLDEPRPALTDHIPRVAVGVPKRAKRLMAIGNGQVPLCAALAFVELSQRMRERA